MKEAVPLQAGRLPPGQPLDGGALKDVFDIVALADGATSDTTP